MYELEITIFPIVLLYFFSLNLKIRSSKTKSHHKKKVSRRQFPIIIQSNSQRAKGIN